MRCPKCECQEDKVIDSRSSKGGAAIRRRRECLKCGARYTTYEEVEKPKKLSVISENGEGVEDFSEERLRSSLQRVCYNLPINGEQMDQVIDRVAADLAAKWGREDIPRREIMDRVMTELRALHKVAYIRYVSFVRQFNDPEEFLNEIKKLEKPYDTLTQRLPGV
jgi:transcriptional repressor NrdR